MTAIPDLKRYFTPSQPAVDHATKDVTYREFWPDSRLQPFIYCYWQLRTLNRLSEPFLYKVVSDGCIDIFFEPDRPEESFVMGFSKKYTEFPLELPLFNYVGMRFFPSMFPQLFKISASELSNRTECLNDVLPKVALFIKSHFHEQQTAGDIKVILDSYFLKFLSHTHFDIDLRFYNAIDMILKKSGVVNLENDLNTGVSPRQLRRLFEYHIGDSAKAFCKVVRFQNILKSKPSRQSLRSNKIYFDLGYYDQAHFIKDFRNFYGVTPSQAFSH